MSDWLRDQHSANTPEDPAVPAAEAEQPSDTQSNIPTEPAEAPATPAAPPETGWSSPAWTQPPVTPPQAPTVPTPPTAGTPADTNPPTVGGWQTGTVSYGGQRPASPPPPSNGGWPPNASYGWQSSQQPSPMPPQKPPKKKWSGTGVLIAVLGVVCAVSLIAAAVLLGGMAETQPNVSSSSTASGNKTTPTAGGDVPQIVTKDPQEEGLSTRDIVKKNLDSTVVITMYTQSSGGYFTGDAAEKAAGVASGIIWTADGYIITNAHCVYNESTRSTYSRIAVTLNDGTEYKEAKIIGYDTATDLAVIKVEATGLTAADFGDSDALELGDRVVVLGNNSGLGLSVTQGCISGLARDVYEETNYAIKCLQTDATINPGNSGGPLLNTSGQVVGINSAKIVAEGYEGLGFSIPIKEATPILENLVEYGYAKGRVKLGITGSSVSYTGYEGFQIATIANDSPLAGTNAQAGDIITHVNGTRVKNYEEMRNELTKNEVGDEITLTLLRVERTGRSNSFDVKVTLQESADSV